MPTSFATAKRQLELAVRQIVKLDTPDKHGSTARQNLLFGREQMRKAGKAAEQLDALFADLKPVELQPGTEHLLGTFAALSNARGTGFNGPLPIAHTDIKAYCELMDEDLTPWEVETIRAIDVAFLDENLKLDAGKE